MTYAQAGAIAGDSDTALLLNGTSGKVVTPSGVSAVGWEGITLETWVKLSSNAFGHKATLWATGTTPTNSGDGFDFWIGANGTGGGFAVGVSGDRWGQATFAQTFTAGVWYHVAGTWDGSTIKLYVNGVQNGATGSVSGAIDSTGQRVTIGQDPQAGADYLPGTLDECALYSKALSSSKLQTHYALGLAQVASFTSFITATPGNVLLLINDVWYPTIRQESIKIDRTANDPIPVFTFNLQDDPSHIPLTELAEVVFIDAGQVPYPTHNLLSNPAMNPYTSAWAYTAHSGVTPSQQAGGGIVLTFANAASGGIVQLSQTTQGGDIVAGQSYMVSVQVAPSGTPVNVQASLVVNLLSATGAVVSSVSTTVPANAGTYVPRVFGGTVLYGASSVTGGQAILPVTVPQGVVSLQVQLVGTALSSTNSGGIIFSQAQLEPMCFTTGNYQLSYPTPWCAAGQTNCFVMPDGTTVRQLRLFGGLITKATAGTYIGANRQWAVTANGYAWLLQKQLLNDSWTNTNDSDIISGIVTKYFPTTFSTAQVATGNQYQGSLAYTYNGYARDAFDALAQASGYIYYADAYRTIWYQPPGYNILPFELSDRPDNVTSFAYYAYSSDTDATQMGNAIYVTGAQGVAAIVIDAQSVGTYNQQMSGAGTFWRTVNDSSIADNQTAISRGQGEASQYNYARPILHLSTNQFMIPGYTVFVTSVPDGLVRQSFIVQKASLTLSGFSGLFTSVYECQCDLGAFNPDLIHVTSKIMRRQVKSTTGGQSPQKSVYGPSAAVVPVIDVMATETINYRDSMTITITSSSPIPGIPTAAYGTAQATYGNPLVGWG